MSILGDGLKEPIVSRRKVVAVVAETALQGDVVQMYLSRHSRAERGAGPRGHAERKDA